MHFTKKFKKAIRETNSHLIVGLDTDVNRVPKFLRSAENPALEFNRIIIEATKDYCCGYKPNSAFYEAMGEKGWTTLNETRKLIPENLITIIDAKRGDISTDSHRALLRWWLLKGQEHKTNLLKKMSYKLPEETLREIALEAMYQEIDLRLMLPTKNKVTRHELIQGKQAYETLYDSHKFTQRFYKEMFIPFIGDKLLERIWQANTKRVDDYYLSSFAQGQEQRLKELAAQLRM